ncbi:hypothetical protein, partial [uncultured Methanobrevibacter sp.]|uniref:hypothetical protein n=1 Tax=uncultured Methanobrevibacter sp. TaxID=253161 RepID=UPI00262A95EE
NNQLNSQLSTLKSENQKLLSENDSIKSNNNQLNSQLSTLKSENQKLKEINQKNTLQISRLKDMNKFLNKNKFKKKKNTGIFKRFLNGN